MRMFSEEFPFNSYAYSQQGTQQSSQNFCLVKLQSWKIENLQ